MQTLILFFAFFISFGGYSAERRWLYDCAHLNLNHDVDRIQLWEVVRGTKKAHEAWILIKGSDARIQTQVKNVYLTSEYGGRILIFSAGTFRVKIDHVRVLEHKYPTFVHLDEPLVHSSEWVCKIVQ